MQKGSFCLFVRILINIKSFWEVLHVGRILRNNKKNLIQNVREQWISITIITMFSMFTMFTMITMITMITIITIIKIKNQNVREWWISITRAKGQQHHQHNNHCKCFYFLSFQLKRVFNIKPWLSLYSCFFSSWKGWSLCLSLGDFKQSFRKR